MKRIAIRILVSCLGFCLQASGQTGTITTVAGGTPFTFPTNVTVALNAPLGNVTGVAVDSKGNIYVADIGNQRVFQVSPAGGIQVVAGNGTAGFSGDGGLATSAELYSPEGVAVDASGNLFIADHDNNRIRKVSASGIISTVAGNDGFGFSGDGGPAISASFAYPSGVAVDASGSLFIADTFNCRIRKVSTSGIISTVAGNGNGGFSGDGGLATSAELYNPGGIAVDASGNLFIADTDNRRIRKVSTSGIISTVAGNGNSGSSGDGGQATSAALAGPAGIAVDASGNLFIADYNRVRKVSTSGIIATVAGNGNFDFSGDGGPATGAVLNQPEGVATDASGNLFIADTQNERIRKVSSGGIITTVAGSASYGFSGDGGPATAASLYEPEGIAVDASGNFFIADYANNRVRKVSTSGVITTVAGNGANGFSGDGGPATSASLNSPSGVAVDASGNLFIADLYNNRIRKVSTSGIITTAAGNGTAGYSGDGGPATSAELDDPQGIAIDASGNLFIADHYNDRIRKVSTSGIISTVAGNGNYGFSGDGGPATSAELQGPGSVAVSASGNVFFGDLYDYRVRRVSPNGAITTVAGNGNYGSSGDGGPSASAALTYPVGVAVDASGNLFIADSVNNRIRKVSPSIAVSQANLTFSVIAGGSVRQQLSLDTWLTSLAWSASASASWLKLGSTSGTGPATITVTANAASLQLGAYTASITISNPLGSPAQETVNVSLTVTATATLSVTPTDLYLGAEQGAASQSQSRSLQIGGTTGAAWTATATTSTGGAWLSISPGSGQIPASLTATINSASLKQGTYQGSITVQEPGATPLSSTISVMLEVTAPGTYIDPQVSSANNSADYSTTIAEGSLFVVFGYSLGPADLAQASSFPLPYVLSETSVTVTSGSTTLNCPMLYTSNGQVAAILPSNTPVGPATITVAYYGITDAYGFSTTQVTVAQSSVGIFTTTGSGAGTALFTALDNTQKTYANAAKPGDTLTIWATGLGPISTPDNALPTSFPDFPNVQVWVGGQSAQGVVARRSACCAGIDEIAFTMPAAANGCNVPVAVVSGGVSSNTVTLPVNSSGGGCSDSGPTLPTSVLTKAAAGQPIKVAGIAIGPAVIGSSGAGAQALAKRLSAALHTQVSEADAARLMQVPVAKKTKGVRVAMGKYTRLWNALDAKTKANLILQFNQTQEGAVAEFGSYGSEGIAATIGSAQLPTAGACVIVPVSNYDSGLGIAQALHSKKVVSTGLDAGASLLLTGAANSFSLKGNVKGQYGVLFGSSITGPNVPPGVYTISGTGGKDVGPFSATIMIGGHLAISNKSSLATVDRTQPLTVMWTGGVSGNYVLIVGNTPGSSTGGTSHANFACAEDGGKGTFTIPSYILSSVNATGAGQGTLVISPHPLSNLVAIPGIDLAYFADGSSDSVNVTFK
jgi:uncharacterized protein (TIGR03437 family)